ncbi:MAG TPA: PhoH family protein [Rhodothermales bacterium]|nr:PhoH family protein [Rhodothermales bacterium]
MAEKVLTIDNAEPVLLFGFNDQYLKKIEAAFSSTTLVARGNRIILRGDENDIKQIERIIDELSLVLSRNSNLTENDVDTILNLVGLDRPARLPDSDDIILFTTTGEAVRARTPGQRRLVAAAEQNDIVFAIGPAGTGKTYTAVALAVTALKARRVKRIVLSRPAVEAGESLGFLPGDLKEKIDPYLRPLYDALMDMLPRDRLADHLAQNMIEIVPLAYMRGRTLNNAYVILDEAQNATTTQMKMFLTRLGVNSRAIVTGDITQTDLIRHETSGLVEARNILEGLDGIAFEYLGKEDVVRHQLVRDIIDAYDRYNDVERSGK